MTSTSWLKQAGQTLLSNQPTMPEHSRQQTLPWCTAKATLSVKLAVNGKPERMSSHAHSQADGQPENIMPPGPPTEEQRHKKMQSKLAAFIPNSWSYGNARWLGSRVVSVLDSGAVGSRFKSQPWHCWGTVLGKLFTPIVPLFTKQWNW